MPSSLQVHRQVLLSNAKISGKTINTFYKFLCKYDTVISKINYDIGQTDLIEIYIATRLDADQVAA